MVMYTFDLEINKNSVTYALSGSEFLNVYICRSISLREYFFTVHRNLNIIWQLQ